MENFYVAYFGKHGCCQAKFGNTFINKLHEPRFRKPLTQCKPEHTLHHREIVSSAKTWGCRETWGCMEHFEVKHKVTYMPLV